ncbi:MAG: hypothetical protein Q8755_02820 [Candidatus Phytoplasma australasiaticum]|nr:hypothetical protein [Candidatus Phytoplasma australasiaticum]
MLAKVKSCEIDLSVMKNQLHEKLPVIDLAHETVEGKEKENASKQQELSEAQIKIIELDKKIEQF